MRFLVRLFAVISLSAVSMMSAAHADSTYTGQMLNLSMANVLKQLNLVSLGPNQLGTTSDTAQYQFSASTTSLQIVDTTTLDIGGGPPPVSTHSVNWQDLDPAQIQETTYSGYPFSRLDVTTKNNLKMVQNVWAGYQDSGWGPVAAGSEGDSSISMQDLGPKATVDHIADLIETAVLLSQGSKYKGSGNAKSIASRAMLLETVIPNPLGDGTSNVDIRNISGKFIHLSASTEACVNLAMAKCGPQLQHILVPPKGRAQFIVDRANDSLPWSFSVKCMVNGAVVGDCSQGGGGGPKSSDSQSDDSTPPDQQTPDDAQSQGSSGNQSSQ